MNPHTTIKQTMSALEKIASIGLTTNESRVLAEMLWSLDERNIINVPARVVAEETGIDRANVSRAIRKLVEVDVLQKIPDPRNRRRSSYQLNDYKKWSASILPPPSNVIHADFRRKNT